MVFCIDRNAIGCYDFVRILKIEFMKIRNSRLVIYKTSGSNNLAINIQYGYGRAFFSYDDIYIFSSFRPDEHAKVKKFTQNNYKLQESLNIQKE